MHIFWKTNVPTRVHKYGYNLAFTKLAPLDSAHTELDVYINLCQKLNFYKISQVVPFLIAGHKWSSDWIYCEILFTSCINWLHGYTLYTHAMDGTTLYMCTSRSRPLIGVYMLINLNILYSYQWCCSTYQSLSLHTDESGWPMNVSPPSPVVLLVASRRLGGDDPPTTTLQHSYTLPLKHIHVSSQSSPPQTQEAPECQVKYYILSLYHTVSSSRALWVHLEHCRVLALWQGKENSSPDWQYPYKILIF